MTARIILPGRLARAGVASRHPVAYAGVKFLDAVHRAGRRAAGGGSPRARRGGCWPTPRACRRPAPHRRAGRQRRPLRCPPGPERLPGSQDRRPLRDHLGSRRHRAEGPDRGRLPGHAGRQRRSRRHDPAAHHGPGRSAPPLGPRLPEAPAGTIGPLNEITLAADSRLARVFDATVVHGACSHHQAIDRLGDALRVVGTTADGMVEAFEHESAPLVAVQWHPEDTAATDPAAAAHLRRPGRAGAGPNPLPRRRVSPARSLRRRCRPP